MPTIYTFNAKFEQPVHVTFQCEYCGHNFTVTGKITTEVKTEKWVSERRKEALAELQVKGEDALKKTRAELEKLTMIGGNLPQRLTNEGNNIRFEGGSVCPECGYHQRIAIPPKGSLRLTIAKLGCGGILLLLFAMGLFSVIQGTATSLAYVFLVGVPLLAVVILALAFRESNRVFMKKHGLKKQDLPQPRKPEIHYGQINSV
jgi:hypothetical protein